MNLYEMLQIILNVFHASYMVVMLTFLLVLELFCFIFIDDGRWTFSLGLFVIASVVYSYTNVYGFLLTFFGIPVILFYACVILLLAFYSHK
jgi:hypothetical protein